MTLSIRLPESLEMQLTAYCRAHRISKSEAVKRALDLFLGEEVEVPEPSPYELGADGFGADRTHSGDIARRSKDLLREKFRSGP